MAVARLEDLVELGESMELGADVFIVQFGELRSRGYVIGVEKARSVREAGKEWERDRRNGHIRRFK